MSRIRALSARSMRLTGHPPRDQLAQRARRNLRDKPLSLTEWILIVAWSCVLMAMVWALLLIEVIRTIRQTL